jgi:plasmid maintenance system killer protein
MLKEYDQLKNAQLIIDTQVAEIRRLNALLETVQVDKSPRIERLEWELKNQTHIAELRGKESESRLAKINRSWSLVFNWEFSKDEPLKQCARELRKQLSYG